MHCCHCERSVSRTGTAAQQGAQADKMAGDAQSDLLGWRGREDVPLPMMVIASMDPIDLRVKRERKRWASGVASELRSWSSCSSCAGETAVMAEMKRRSEPT